MWDIHYVGLGQEVYGDGSWVKLDQDLVYCHDFLLAALSLCFFLFSYLVVLPMKGRQCSDLLNTLSGFGILFDVRLLQIECL